MHEHNKECDHQGRCTITGAIITSPERMSFLKVCEVAAIMRVSKMTVYRLVHGGELASLRVGGSFRVPKKSVQEYLDLHLTNAKKP